MTSPIQDIPITRIDGSPAKLGDYAGKVALVVNVASKCGLTKQYDGLEALYRDYRDRGFVVLGFPANDFKGQEPGSDAEIQDFCRSTFGVDFPMFSKVAVRGAEKHPLYQALTEAMPRRTSKPDSDFVGKLAAMGQLTPEGEVAWNFEKFLVDRDGNVVGRFAPDLPPQDDIVVSAIEAQLAR
jgi:glutathione peroxidase